MGQETCEAHRGQIGFGAVEGKKSRSAPRKYEAAPRGEKGIGVMTSTELITAEQFWKEFPHCIGYPGCDGDLEGTSHEPGCPLFCKREIGHHEFADALSARNTE